MREYELTVLIHPDLEMNLEAATDKIKTLIESNGGKKDFLLEYERLLDEDDVTYLKIGSLRFAVKGRHRCLCHP